MSSEPGEVTPQYEPRCKFCRLAKTWLIVLTLFALVALNIATLISDSVYTVASHAIEWSLQHALPDATATRLLNESPAKKQLTLRKSHQALEKKHAELKRVSAIRSSKVKAVTSRIATRAAKNAAKNLGGLATEVIPYVGAAAVVAITASDLFDDCQTLKDVNEVNVEFGHEKADDATVCGMKVPSLDELRAKTFSTVNWWQ